MSSNLGNSFTPYQIAKEGALNKNKDTANKVITSFFILTSLISYLNYRFKKVSEELEESYFLDTVKSPAGIKRGLITSLRSANSSALVESQYLS